MNQEVGTDSEKNEATHSTPKRPNLSPRHPEEAIVNFHHFSAYYPSQKP